jgi:hypothetical protein
MTHRLPCTGPPNPLYLKDTSCRLTRPLKAGRLRPVAAVVAAAAAPSMPTTRSLAPTAWRRTARTARTARGGFGLAQHGTHSTGRQGTGRGWAGRRSRGRRKRTQEAVNGGGGGQRTSQTSVNSSHTLREAYVTNSTYLRRGGVTVTVTEALRARARHGRTARPTQQRPRHAMASWLLRLDTPARYCAQQGMAQDVLRRT